MKLTRALIALLLASCVYEPAQLERLPADATGDGRQSGDILRGDPANPGDPVLHGDAWPGVCGNGIHEPGELCDDGNDIDWDECSRFCRVPPAIRVQIRGPAHVPVNGCVPFEIALVDPWGVERPIGADTTLMVEGSFATNVTNDISCGNPITGVPMGAGSSRTTVYFQPTLPGENSLTASAPRFLPDHVSIEATAVDVVHYQIHGPAWVASERCTPFTVQRVDGAGAPVTAGATTVTFRTYGALVLSGPPDCGDGYALIDVALADGESAFVVHMKDPDTQPVPRIITLEARDDAGSPPTVREIVMGPLATRPDALTGGPGALLNMPAWAAAEVDPTISNHIVAVDLAGNVMDSDDAGSTWAHFCQLPDTISARTPRVAIYTAPGPDFVLSGADLFRIEDVGTDPCTRISDTLASLSNGHLVSSVAVDENGDLLAWASSDGKLAKSTDAGDSWSTVSAGLGSNDQFGWLATDPRDADRMLLNFVGGAAANGMFRSTDGGVTFSQVSGGTFTDTYGHTLFDPLTDHAYHSGGYYSSDSGANWSTNAELYMSPAWTITTAGVGYRLEGLGDTTAVAQATGGPVSSWQTVGTQFLFPHYPPWDSISASASTVAMVLARRLWVSTDSANNFTIRPAATERILASGVATTDGKRVVAVDIEWDLFESADGGRTWSRGLDHANAHPLTPARVFVHPQNSNHVRWRAQDYGLSSDPEMWVTTNGLGASPYLEQPTPPNQHDVLGQAVDDENILVIVGPNMRRSTNGGVDFANVPFNPVFPEDWHPLPQAWVKPGAPLLVWAGDGVKFYELNFAAGSFMDITGRIGEPVAGSEVIDTRFGYVLRVITSTGQVYESWDGASSFTTLSAPPDPLFACERRLLISHPDVPSAVATACLLDHHAAWSGDGGSIWHPLTDICAVRGIAVTDHALLIACRDGELQSVQYH